MTFAEHKMLSTVSLLTDCFPHGGPQKAKLCSLLNVYTIRITIITTTTIIIIIIIIIIITTRNYAQRAF